ncbi:MAG: hypothetical protein K1X78_07735 [Verrucomicrobiaceae bacterium]|nr:hypothetical protein [Verrucomicrobiaceae bacterium]
MRHPIYTTIGIIACAYLALANLRGWSFYQSSVNRAAFSNTAYRYRPAFNTSGGSGGGWSFGGGGHK